MAGQGGELLLAHLALHEPVLRFLPQLQQLLSTGGDVGVHGRVDVVDHRAAALPLNDRGALVGCKE